MTPISPTRMAQILFIAGLLILIIWGGMKAWRLVQIAQSLQGYQLQAETLTQDGLMSANPDEAEALVMGLRQDVVALDRELRPFVPLARQLAWLPRIGPLMGDSEPLLDMALSGSEAAAYAVRGLKPALATLQDGATAGEGLLSTILPPVQGAEADLIAASAALDRAIAARQRITNIEQYPWRVRSLLELIDGKLYLADELRLLTVAPALLGAEGPRTYLLLVQNEDEIRATGGFLTGAGLLTVENGQIVDLSFQDGNTIDDWRNKPYEFPPEPYYDLMGLELFLYRDANYWPDFPTSAEQAVYLYRYGLDGAPPLDGAIAIDQQFVAMLLAVTGPLEVPQLETRVSANNALETFREAWGPGEDQTFREWLSERKDFLGPLAQALRDKLLGDFGSIDPLYLAETLHRAAQEKRIQIYARDAQVANVLAHIGWDGRQEFPDDGDYLMIVDMNVGYNKVNSLIRSNYAYEVVLSGDGSAQAELTVTYEHTGEAMSDPCQQSIPYVEGITYQELMEQCYWNYMRIYTPPGITPHELPAHPADTSAIAVTDTWFDSDSAVVLREQGGFDIISNRFVLAQGDQLVSRYAYGLPVVVGKENGLNRYRLTLQRQASASTSSMEVQITLPDGAEIVETSHNATISGRDVTFEYDMRADIVFEVAYR